MEISMQVTQSLHEGLRFLIQFVLPVDEGDAVCSDRNPSQIYKVTPALFTWASNSGRLASDYMSCNLNSLKLFFFDLSKALSPKPEILNPEALNPTPSTLNPKPFEALNPTRVVVTIMVPFWIPRHLIFRVPKTGTIILTTTHITHCSSFHVLFHYPPYNPNINLMGTIILTTTHKESLHPLPNLGVQREARRAFRRKSNVGLGFRGLVFRVQGFRGLGCRV